jgi:hypothetical protein
MTALMYFMDLTPIRIREEVALDSMKHPEFWGDVWSMALQQSHRILKIVTSVADVVVQPSGEFDAQVSATGVLRQIESTGEVGSVQVEGADALKPLLANRAMVAKLFSILLKRTHVGSADSEQTEAHFSELPSVWGTPGMQLRLSGKGPGWNANNLVGLFTPFCQIDGNPEDLGLDLLSAFFIVHHHGGELTVRRFPDSPGFVLQLPYDPNLAKRPSLEQDCLEKVFTRFSDQELF